MAHSLSRSAAVLPLLLSTALFTSDTGKELAKPWPLRPVAEEELELNLLEYDPVASACSAGSALTLRRAEDDSGPSREFACVAPKKSRVANCYSYSWGWRCYYATYHCDFYATGFWCRPYPNTGW
jgi:hypothetical protein